MSELLYPLIFILSPLCIYILIDLMQRVDDAVQIANSHKPFNPPPSMMIDKSGKIISKKGSRKLAWLRFFLREI